MADRLKADDENALEPVFAEGTYDGLPRTSRAAKSVAYAARKQKGRGNRAK
jgi:hypothetical protein